MDISSFRKDYKLKTLDEAAVCSLPHVQFENWFEEAVANNVPEVNAMVLSTSTLNGFPSARVVLLKGVGEKGFVFFTNYNSQKGKEIEENPRVCLTFFWPQLERQVRVEGIVHKTSAEESDVYFQSRPVESRIGAWASDQSKVVPDREYLEEQYEKFKGSFSEADHIPKPDHWGGYRLEPHFVEFWQGGAGRLHDRICYEKESASQEWKIYRLAP